MFSFVHRTVFLSMIIAGLACFALVEITGASSFQVNPIRITLTPQGASSLVAVRNEGSDRLRLQVDFYAWDQSKQGEMILNPTDDLVVYPSLLTVDAGNERNVRVGTKSPVVFKGKIISDLFRGTSSGNEAGRFRNSHPDKDRSANFRTAATPQAACLD